MTQSTETATAVREALNFVGGEWAAAERAAPRSTSAIRSPARPSCARPRARATMRGARSRPPRTRSPRGRRRRPACARGSSCVPPTSSRAVVTRSSACWPARPAAPSGSACSRCIFTPGLLRQAAGAAYGPVGEVIPSDVPGAMAMGLRQPVGVVGAIAPWNAALILSLRSITAPLALGNTVVLKPSEWSPVSGGTLWGEIFAEAGLPAGVLNIVTHAPGEATPGSATSSSRTRPCGGSTSRARRRPAAGWRRRAGVS